MGEINKQYRDAEEIIAAFDREREEAHEHRRRHDERVRASRNSNRPAHNERQRTK